MMSCKKILVIKLGALGDFIQLTGYYSAVRRLWPSAHITLMTGKAFFNIAKQSGYFDDYIEDNRTWNPLDYMRIIRTVVKGKFDLIIDLQRQTRTKKRYYSLIRWLSKGSFCWAYPNNGKLFLRHILPKPCFLWGKDKKEPMPFVPDRASLDFCKAKHEVLAKLPGRYVLLIPGCSPEHPYKRWPATYYRELALRLSKQNIYSVVLGTNAEKKEIGLICHNNPMAVDFCNQSALLDIPEIAKKSLAVVGNDTGPQHMAELSDIPAVTLFCAKTQNSAIHRENITNLVSADIAEITVDQVFQVLQSLWHKA